MKTKRGAQFHDQADWLVSQCFPTGRSERNLVAGMSKKVNPGSIQAGGVDKTSRWLAILSLGVSSFTLFTAIFTTFYVSIEERYSVVFKFQPIGFTQSADHSLKINPIYFSFDNNGNRPVSIQGLYFAFYCIGSDLTAVDWLEIDNKTSSIGNRRDSFDVIHPKDFKPFSIKPSEIEVRTYAFPEELVFNESALKECFKEKGISFSIFVNVYSSFRGTTVVRKDIKQTPFDAKLDDGITFRYISDKDVDGSLIKGRWPINW